MPLYSNSRLNKFEECPQAYKFKYIDNIETETRQNIYGFLGSRVHETLERLYKDLKNGKRNSLNELLEYYENLWEEEWSDGIQIFKERYSPEDFKKVGKNCIRNYYGKHEPFDQNKTVDTELMIYPKVEVDGEEYAFQGYIDRLDLASGEKYEIHDYKTSKNLPSRDQVENKRQLPLYQLGVQQKYPDAEDVELVWHFVRFGKDIRVSHCQEDIEEVQENLADTIEKIERARDKGDFPTGKDDGANCDWCDYKSYCPEWKHKYETRSESENEFLEEEGVELVDELTRVEKRIEDIEEEKNELEEKRDKLEEAILEYADRENIRAVFGSEKKASIKIEEIISFPKSDEPGREELDRLVRESGEWGDLSTSYLNISTLRKAYREEDLSEDLLGELEDFKEIKKSRKVELEVTED